MRNHVIKELIKCAKIDQRMILVTADLGFGVLEGFAQKYPERYINVGIAEQNLAAMAAGLALEGNMVFMYSIGNFPTLRCIEQIRNLGCYHNANIKILATGGGFAYGSLGMTHHATEDVAMMRALPNMKVYVPADAIEAMACFDELCKYDGPGYLRMARGKEANIHDIEELKNLDVTRLVSIVDGGPNVVLFAMGTILKEAVLAAKQLRDFGILVSVYSVPAVKPIDEEGIKRLAIKANLFITMEEHNIIGGLGGAVAEVLSEINHHALLMRFGLHDTFTEEVGDQEYLRKYYHMSASDVVEEVVRYCKEGKL